LGNRRSLKNTPSKRIPDRSHASQKAEAFPEQFKPCQASLPSPATNRWRLGKKQYLEIMQWHVPIRESHIGNSVRFLF
jgi:hypothetical protein